MSWFQWKSTDALNATADPTINWAEGQSPSSVNDSARSLMGRSAEWRDLISGKLVTTGTGTALVLATLQTTPFDTLAHMDGQMIAFIPNVTNTGTVTLAVDGLAAKPIRSQTGTTGNLSAGMLVQGTPYVVTYLNATNEFILQGFTGADQFSVPIGGMIFHSVAAVPNSNWIMPIGQAISRSLFSSYFALVGTTYGPGNGTTTFNAPDLSNRIPVPSTLGGGVARVTVGGCGVNGGVVGAAGGLEAITLNATQMPAHTHTFSGAPLAGHSHAYTSPIIGTGQNTPGAFGTSQNNPTVNGGTTSSVGAGTPEGLNSTTGGGLAHNNMPPVIVLGLILRVL